MYRVQELGRALGRRTHLASTSGAYALMPCARRRSATLVVLAALSVFTGCQPGSGGGGQGGTGGAGGGTPSQCADIAGIQVVTAPSVSPAVGYYVSAQADCPAGTVAIGGGVQFVDMATGSTKDGILMSSLPAGGSPGTAPTGWLASGSTQYTGGLGTSDQLVVYAVCAAPGLNPSTVTNTAQFAAMAPPPFYLSAQASCPSGHAAIGGGVRFADATSAKDGLLMSNLPDFTIGNSPTGWIASGSAQFTTAGGNDVGDRIDVQGVCADVCAAAAIEVVTAPSAPTANTYYHVSQANCPVGKVAISGGARFADSSATADGALMRSMPVFMPGAPPTGWIAAGSTQYLGEGSPGDHIVAYAVCAVVSP